MPDFKPTGDQPQAIERANRPDVVLARQDAQPPTDGEQHADV